MSTNSDVEVLKAHVGTYQDFPKKGILFRDMLPIFQNVNALKALENVLVNHVKSLPEIHAIVALEARGFLLAPIVAIQCGIPVIVVRKKGKLPCTTKSVTYSLEYGQATFEIQDSSITPGQKVLVMDDLLATGGSAKAACDLIQQLGGEIVQLLVLMELTALNGREVVPCPVHSIISY